MNNGSRNRILVLIIAILLISNIILLVLLLRMDKKTQENRPGFTERLKKDVGFTPQQMAIFEPKKKAFWNSMRDRFEAIKTTKQQFYFQIYDPAIPDSVIENKAQEIGTQQKELDLQVIRHFKDVRKLCTHDQEIKFDSMVPYIIQRMTAFPVNRK
jgi:protein CpxP